MRISGGIPVFLPTSRDRPIESGRDRYGLPSTNHSAHPCGHGKHMAFLWMRRWTWLGFLASAVSTS